MVSLIDPSRIRPERTDHPDGHVEFVFPRRIIEVDDGNRAVPTHLNVSLAGTGSVQIRGRDGRGVKVVSLNHRTLVVKPQ